MNLRKLIPGVVIGCFGLVALLCVAGYYVIRDMFGPGPDPGPPRVVLREPALSVKPFASAPSVGLVTDIAVGKVDGQSAAEVAVAGRNGAVYLASDGTTLSWVQFAEQYGHVDVIDVEGDGICEFLNRGQAGSNAALINHGGRTLWSYDAGIETFDGSAGDVDGDGVLEFALGMNGGGGVHLLGADGRKRWRHSDADVWHVEVADTDGDGTAEVLHSNARGELTVLSRRGDVVGRRTLGEDQSPVDLYNFALCPWPSGDRQVAIITLGGQTIHVNDVSGKQLAELRAPQADSLGDVWATAVKLQAGEPPYLAVVANLGDGPRSILYLYDAAQRLRYREVLADPCEALAALPAAKGSAESLLVGGSGRVARYSWVPAVQR